MEDREWKMAGELRRGGFVLRRRALTGFGALWHGLARGGEEAHHGVTEGTEGRSAKMGDVRADIFRDGELWGDLGKSTRSARR